MLKRKRCGPWTNDELDFLKANYASVLASDIGNRLDRPTSSIYKRAKDLGLKKDQYPFNKGKKAETYMTTAGLQKMKSNQFRPGQSPPNKGKKMEEFASSETIRKFRANSYKKGHLPKNTLYNGAITSRKDKNGYTYKWIRISLGKWVMLHVYNWEQVNGKVPKGHIIVFKSVDHMNCEVSNLELITLDENMRRNSIQNYPVPVKKAMRLTGKLKRQLKKHEQN